MAKNIVEITKEFLAAKVAEGKLTEEEMKALLAVDDDEEETPDESDFTSLERVAMGYIHGFTVRMV